MAPTRSSKPAGAKPKPRRKPKAKPKAPAPKEHKNLAQFCLTQQLDLPAWAPPNSVLTYWSVNGKVQYVLEQRGRKLMAPTLAELASYFELGES